MKYEGVAFSLLDPSSFSFVKMKLFGYCVIRLSDLVDLWVIRIKKPMILWARSTSRSREQSMNTDHAARTCEQFAFQVLLGWEGKLRSYDLCLTV